MKVIHTTISSIALIIAVAVAGAVMLIGQEPSESAAPLEADGDTDAMVDAEQSQLYVDPIGGETDLTAFKAAYATAKNKFFLRELYAEYLPKIGANGLISGIEAVTPLCHDEAHDLGKVIFAELGEVGAALETCQDACASGCMHGVLMEYFTGSTEVEPHEHAEGETDEHVTDEQIRANIPGICDTAAFTETYLPGDCAHGVGHAVMFLSDYQIEKALEYCGLFPDYPMEYYCATGAYMEYNNVKGLENVESGKGYLFPCDTSPYPAACFRYKLVQSFQVLYSRKEGSNVITDQCLAFEGNVRLGCFHGVGNAHMGFIARGQTTLGEVCKFGTADDQLACVDGAMERLSKYYPNIALSKCETVTGALNDMCVAAVERGMYSLTKSFDYYQK